MSARHDRARRLDAVAEKVEERKRRRRERALAEFRRRRDAGDLDDPDRVRERERITAEVAATPQPDECSEREGESLLYEPLPSEPSLRAAQLRRFRDALLASVIDDPDGPRRDVFLFVVLAADDALAARWW